MFMKSFAFLALSVLFCTCGVLAWWVPSVSVTSPLNLSYSDPDVDFSFDFSTPDLGIVDYSLNGAPNVRVGYEVGDYSSLGVVVLWDGLTGVYSDDNIIGVSATNGNIYALNKISMLPSVLVGDGSVMLSIYGDDEYIYGSNENGYIFIWNLTDFSFVTSLSDGAGSNMTRVYIDQNYVYGSSMDGNIYIYNRDGTFGLNTILTDADGGLKDVYADSVYIYGASTDSNLYLWNASTMSYVTNLTDPTDVVQAVRAFPDFIHAGSSDGVDYVWNKSTLSLYNTCNVFGDMYYFDRDADNVLIADSYGDLTVCKEDGSLDGYYVGDVGEDINLGVAADNNYIYTANADGTIDVRAKNRQQVVLPSVDGLNILDVVASDNYGVQDFYQVNYTVSVPFPVVNINLPAEGSTLNSSHIFLDWSHNVPSLSWAGYSLNGASNVTFPSFFAPSLITTLEQSNEAFQVYSDNNYIYSSDRLNNRVNVYDKSDFSLVTRLNDGAGLSFGVTADDDFIYEANSDCKVHIYNKADFSLNTTLDDGDIGGTSCSIEAIHVDGDYIYGGWQQGVVFVWNKTTMQQIGNLSILMETFSIETDSDRIYVADVELPFTGSVRVFNKTNFSEIGNYVSGSVGFVNEVVVDDDFVYAAKQLSLLGGEIVIWNKTDYSIVDTLTDSESDVRGLHVDEDYIYGTDSYSYDTYDLLIWDKSSRNLLYRLTDPVTTIADVFVDADYIYVGMGGSGFGGIYVYNAINPINYLGGIEGNNTLTISVNDTFGNMNSTTVDFIVDTELIFDYVNLSSNYSDAIVQFRVLNNYLPAGDFDWTLDFGDGNVVHNTLPVSLGVLEDVYVIAQHSYDSPGSYTIVMNVTNGTITDSESHILEVV